MQEPSQSCTGLSSPPSNTFLRCPPLSPSGHTRTFCRQYPNRHLGVLVTPFRSLRRRYGSFWFRRKTKPKSLQAELCKGAPSSRLLDRARCLKRAVEKLEGQVCMLFLPSRPLSLNISLSLFVSSLFPFCQQRPGVWSRTIPASAPLRASTPPPPPSFDSRTLRPWLSAPRPRSWRARGEKRGRWLLPSGPEQRHRHRRRVAASK